MPLAKAVIRVENANNLEMLGRVKHLLEYLANIKEVEFVNEIGQCSEEEYVRAQGRGYEICLSKVMDKKLYYEALAREVVRRIQTMRAKANLKVDERIRVYVSTGSDDLLSAIKEFMGYITNEVRATDVIVGNVPANAFAMDWDIEDMRVRIGIERITQ
ncbi:DUF5915 domain-containing protein [Vulcanisaeta distributa]|uniref:DUF5915 domain-containing protein n=1 Tax=Vulcanisaeta distributa TaxID=164451 RepID=UPI000A9C1CFE|nr:DUF5915 domain-containing protein [Vulcanisaeta distributa]